MTAVLPERGENARQLRWTAPAGTFPARGEVVDFGPDESTPTWLARARVVSSSVLVTDIRAPQSWAELGDEGWAFVRRAVAKADAWRIDTDAPDETAGPADARLRHAVDTVLEGPFGDLVRSHRGRVELVRVRDGAVSIRLSGTCGSCSLSDWTVRQRLERDLRAAAGSDFAELLVLR